MEVIYKTLWIDDCLLLRIHKADQVWLVETNGSVVNTLVHFMLLLFFTKSGR